jgi:hypothetical protein
MEVRVVGDDNGGHDTFTDGRVDAHTLAFGEGDTPRLAPTAAAGVLTGGVVPAMAYSRQILGWGETPHIAPENKLTLNLVNLKTITVDMARAGLTCDAPVDVTTDGPVTITFAGCDRVVQADAVSASLTNLPNRSVTVARSTSASPA